MYITCLDLEGVLVPEIWIAFAEESGIPELRRTTRDEPDYDKLMRWRLGILKEHGLGLPEIQAVIAKIDPLPGAKEFMDELRSQTQAVILSDTFAEFAQKALPMLKRALVKKTVAKALRRFDILEFPATIRNLFDDNTSTRQGSDEASRALQLATQLDGEVEDLLHNVDMLLDAQEGNDFLSFSAENRMDDNMYLMP